MLRCVLLGAVFGCRESALGNDNAKFVNGERHNYGEDK